MATNQDLLVQSPTLKYFEDLAHGSTTRHFSQREANRTAETRAFLELLGLEAGTPVVHGDQVHGNTVAVVRAESMPHDPDADGRAWIPETDALITPDPDILLVVYSADCVPLLLWDPTAEIVGVVHAGWRGTLARITEKTLEAMVELGSDPLDVMAWIGPAAGPSYEVSPELAEQFAGEFGDFPMEPPWMRGRHLNLPQINALQLAIRGVSPSQIMQSGFDTLTATDRFYSYRRDGGPTGRILTGICRRTLPAGSL
jgi:YfiH family protein